MDTIRKKTLMTIFKCISIVLIVCAIYYIILQFTTKEGFGDPTSVLRPSQSVPDILDLTHQFEDMLVYNNDPDGRLGLDKCIEDCQGYCVEFGQTGTAYCFPVRETTPKDFSGVVADNEQKLSFPNVE